MPCLGFCGFGWEGGHLPECNLLALQRPRGPGLCERVDSGGRAVPARVAYVSLAAEVLLQPAPLPRLIEAPFDLSFQINVDGEFLGLGPPACFISTRSHPQSLCSRQTQP